MKNVDDAVKIAEYVYIFPCHTYHRVVILSMQLPQSYVG